MFVTPSIWCHNQPFFKSYDLRLILWISSSHLFDNFTHAHPIMFFPGFLTWGFHSHFVKVRYTIRKPIGRSVVYSSSPILSSPYSNNSPYLCFPFLGGWYTYSIYCIKCGLFFQCNSTCWDQHFPILDDIIRCLSHVTLECQFSCPTFWELSGLVLPPIANFFGGSLTWIGICFLSNRCSFGYCMNTFLLMWRVQG